MAIADADDLDAALPGWVFASLYFHLLRIRYQLSGIIFNLFPFSRLFKIFEHFSKVF